MRAGEHTQRVDAQPDSIAAVVLEPAARAARRPSVVPRAEVQPGSIAGEVFGAGRRSFAPLRMLAAGAAVAASVHVLAVAAVWRSPPGEGRAVAPEPRPLRIDHVVDLNPPPLESEPPPSEPPPPEPPAAKRATAAVPSRAPAPANEARAATPPPPAQAGQVVTAEGPPDPLDFTGGFDITTGEGPVFAGGVTASSGTNTRAVHTRTVDRSARPDQPQGEGSLARPVSLPARSWQCPWPREAEALGIDEQVVVLRVVVDASGRVSTADLIADPGHGFGPAALTCARTARFEPARDRSGRGYAATSPPIRVRFTR